MIHAPMLVLLVIRAPAWRGGGLRQALRVLIPLGVGAGLLLAAVFLPYLSAAGRNSRQPREILTYGTSLAGFATPAARNLYTGPWTEGWQRPENALFAGFLPTALALLAARRGWRHCRTPPLRPLSPGRRAALLALSLVLAAAWLLGELRVWCHFLEVPAPDLRWLRGHRLGVSAMAAGLLALVLRRAWGGNWPFRLAGLDPWKRGLLMAGLLCVLLSVPLLYLPLMRVIPGLAGMRAPARFYAFVSFSLAFFAAGELDRRLRGLAPAGRRLAAGLAGAFLLLELTPRPVDWEPLPLVPAVYHWLARQNQVTALLELPLGTQTTDSIPYLYYATFHWKPLVNGYSGYLGDEFIELRERCCWPLPDAQALARLRGWGVTHIHVHRRALTRPWQRRNAALWARQPGITLEYRDRRSRVYRIIPGAPAAAGRKPS
jgi:hypothetical protein